MIFTYLPFEDQKNACLVCKVWCRECTSTFGDSVKILLTATQLDTVRLKRCRFERLSVTLFGEILVTESLWQRIGKRIYELKLDGCRVTDQLTYYVPRYCKNLRFLQLHLSVGNLAFRSDAQLNRMKRVCSELETIDIVVLLCERAFTKNEFMGWNKICKAYNLVGCLNRVGRLACRLPIKSEVELKTLLVRLRNFLKARKIKDYSVNLIGRK